MAKKASRKAPPEWVVTSKGELVHNPTKEVVVHALPKHLQDVSKLQGHIEQFYRDRS